MAVTEKVAGLPLTTVSLLGWTVMAGAWSTVRIAAEEVTEFRVLLTVTV